MKLYRKTCFLPLVIMLALVTPAFSGQSPFSDQAIRISTSGDTSASSPNLPAIVDGKPEIATVDVATTLNIRTSPWGDIIGNVKGGTKITIIGQLGDWYKVSVNGKTAYVHSTYVKRDGEGAKPFPSSGKVNALGLNVRRVPHGDILAVLKQNQSVEILGVSGDWYKIRWGENEAFVAKRYIDTDTSKPAAESDGVAKEDFIGYVTADALNVRSSPWGAIDGTIPNGIAVKVTGKTGDWYRIDYNGKVRYVHASYISKTRGGESTTPPPSTGTPAASGSLQQKIVAAAKDLIGSTNFRTADVDYGNLACAKVVTTALKNAGAVSRVQLNCRSAISDLKDNGWKEVSVPPFAEGDVITWKTYDYTGDGVKDPDTHIGIMVKDGNTFKAMNNSSRLRTPRLSDPYSIGPVSRVLRKVA